MVAGHGLDLGDQFLADVFGDGFLSHLGGEVEPALGGVFMEGTLQELKGLVDLAFELFLAEPESLGGFAHKYAYIYAYFKAAKPARQWENVKINSKNAPQELNCYVQGSAARLGFASSALCQPHGQPDVLRHRRAGL